MSAKHTPGPWDARIQRGKDGRDLGWIIEHGNDRIGWSSLAYADTNREADATDPAREANARLIAAAPDLLEALKRAENWLSEWASAEPYLAIIRAAIAKAEA